MASDDAGGGSQRPLKKGLGKGEGEITVGEIWNSSFIVSVCIRGRILSRKGK